MASIKTEIVKFTRTNGSNPIDVVITKERGKKAVVTSTVTDAQVKFLRLKSNNVFWKSYTQASAKLRAYGWIKEVNNKQGVEAI